MGVFKGDMKLFYVRRSSVGNGQVNHDSKQREQAEF